MDHGFHIGQGEGNSVGIANVALNSLGVLQLDGESWLRAMHLRGEAVQDTYRVPVAKKCLDEMAADEPGSASN
jgi:hypothetical protein